MPCVLMNLTDLPKRQHFEQELIREVLSTQLFGVDFQFSGNSEKEAIRDRSCGRTESRPGPGEALPARREAFLLDLAAGC